jgi:hypothetical protein
LFIVSSIPFDDVCFRVSALFSARLQFDDGRPAGQLANFFFLSFSFRSAVAIFIPDTLPHIPETIIVRGSTWSVIDIDDPEIGHRRSHLHIPDSTSWISHCSFRDSFVESI